MDNQKKLVTQTSSEKLQSKKDYKTKITKLPNGNLFFTTAFSSTEVDIRKIVCVIAKEQYIKFYYMKGPNPPLIRCSMCQLEPFLISEKIIRPHYSHFVNIDFMILFFDYSKELLVLMKNKMVLRVARLKRNDFFEHTNAYAHVKYLNPVRGRDIKRINILVQHWKTQQQNHRS